MSAPRPRAVLALRREPGHLVRSFTALILRVSLGMIFLAAGFQKYQDMQAPAREASDALVEPTVIEEAGVPAEETERSVVAESTASPAETAPRYPESIKAMFAESVLAERMPAALDLYVQVLPYAEMGIGAALLLGFWTPVSATLSGLLLVSLLFGWVILGKNDQYPMMLTYLLTNAAILWLSPVTSNYLSLDGLLFGWFWRPRSEGSFERAETDQVNPRIAPIVVTRRP